MAIIWISIGSGSGIQMRYKRIIGNIHWVDKKGITKNNVNDDGYVGGVQGNHKHL